MATKELATIFDHEHVDFDGNEFNRIEENFRNLRRRLRAGKIYKFTARRK